MKLELCVASLEAVKLAKELNFDRIELCQNLDQGGVTPSFGMIEYAVAYGLETHVLIRPRPGNFCYNAEELEISFRDILACKELGVAGIVFGALKNYEIDIEVMKEIRAKCSGIQLTFHRAFDDTLDWKKSIDQLIEIGVDRILSSGLSGNVDKGFQILKQMKEYANDRIEIMCGGGVNSNNIVKIQNEIQPNGIHFSGTIKKLKEDDDSLFAEEFLQVDESRVKRILQAVKN